MIITQKEGIVKNDYISSFISLNDYISSFISQA